MSEKSAKKIPSVTRIIFLYHYKKFLEDVAKLGIKDRIRIAWQVIKDTTKNKKEKS